MPNQWFSIMNVTNGHFAIFLHIFAMSIWIQNKHSVQMLYLSNKWLVLFFLQLTLKPDQIVLEIVNKLNDRTTTDGVFHQHPEIVANVATVIQHLLYEPFYWKLPEQFEGEKVISDKIILIKINCQIGWWKLLTCSVNLEVRLNWWGHDLFTIHCIMVSMCQRILVGGHSFVFNQKETMVNFIIGIVVICRRWNVSIVTFVS